MQLAKCGNIQNEYSAIRILKSEIALSVNPKDFEKEKIL
jgi:hypothetical protein